MERNTEAICRACLRKCKRENVSLHDTIPMEPAEPAVSYAEAYTSCTQLEVQLGLDGLPEWLCNSCDCDMQFAYHFRRKARKSFEKLCNQLKLEKQEYVARTATPAEFALPDNSETDLMVACSLQGENWAKDPLDDLESDNESKPNLDNLYIGMQSPAFMEVIYDSDDETPLEQLPSSLTLPAVRGTPNTKALPVCDFSFNDDDDFIVDKGSKNDKVTDLFFSPEAQIFLKGRFKCTICDHRYFTTVGLKAHMEVHKSKKKHASHFINCRKSVKSRTETEVLIPDLSTNKTSNQHAPSDVDSKVSEEVLQTNESKAGKTKKPKPKRMLPCKVCGKQFISASKLRYHMVMHTGERNYLCTMCPNSYTTIYGLRHHIRSHTGERPYECKFCGDRFLRTTTLKSHQRRHTGERPYGCDICGKRFIQHSSMATHMRLNHMDKTIQCPHCIKKYARQTDLNAHLLSHTGYKPFRCQLCPSRFVRQSNLNKHMNQQHTTKKSVAEPYSNSNPTGVNFVDKCFDYPSTGNISNIPNDMPKHILENEDL